MDMQACTEALRAKVGESSGLNATLKFDCGADGVAYIDGRFDRLDALRGLAIVWMALFHFCLRPQPLRLAQPRSRTSTPTRSGPCSALHRQPVPVLRRARPGRGAARRAGLAALLAALGAGGRLRLLVSIGSALMFPQQLDQLRRAARHRADADRGARWPPRCAAGCGRWALLALAAAGCVQHPFFDTPLDQLGGPGHAQAGHRGLRAGAALAGRDAVGPGRRAVAAAHRRPALLAGAVPAARCAAGRARPLER
jgi:hypothetical protein